MPDLGRRVDDDRVGDLVRVASGDHWSIVHARAAHAPLAHPLSQWTKHVRLDSNQHTLPLTINIANFMSYARPSARSQKNPLRLDSRQNISQRLLVTGFQTSNRNCVALDSFNFHARRGRASLSFSDGRGREFQGHAMMPLVTFASDLVAEVARRNRGRLRLLDVDLGRGVLRAIVDGSAGEEEVHIHGVDFENSVRPRSASLIEWAEVNYE